MKPAQLTQPQINKKLRDFANEVLGLRSVPLTIKITKPMGILKTKDQEAKFCKMILDEFGINVQNEISEHTLYSLANVIEKRLYGNE